MPLRRFVPHTIVLAVVLCSFTAATAGAMATPLPDGPNDFNSPGFVVRHAWLKFGFLATEPFRDHLSASQEDAKVARFFALNGQIADHERVVGDPATDASAVQQARAELPQLRSERARLQNTVQVILEGRLTKVIKEAGLTRSFGADVVWPPVNIEFQNPPSVLVKSPRNEIRKESETLLQGDLPIERVQQIEAGAEHDGETSALVAEIGGIAMYPAIIPQTSDYHFVLQDIAHEWTHHYLYFAPLGRRYFETAKLTTLNETLANMVGRELGDRMFAEYPLQSQMATAAPVSDDARARNDLAAPPGIDFVAEMRRLRLQVEQLLAQGNVGEAEQAMDEKRAFLAANGYYIRRLNQAYFAFYGSYADTAASVDPIGPKFEQLRAKSTSLRDFVDTARQFKSEADLDAALSAR